MGASRTYHFGTLAPRCLRFCLSDCRPRVPPAFLRLLFLGCGPVPPLACSSLARCARWMLGVHARGSFQHGSSTRAVYSLLDLGFFQHGRRGFLLRSLTAWPRAVPWRAATVISDK